MLVAPLAEKSIASLKAVASSLEANPTDVMRVNCYTSSVEDHAGVQALANGCHQHRIRRFSENQEGRVE